MLEARKSIMGLVAIIVAILLTVVFGLSQLHIGPWSLDRRVDKGFSELELPSTFTEVHVVRKKHKGDLITGAIVAEARTYRVDSNMEQARHTLSTVLLREQDAKVDDDDRRLTMHSGGLWQLNDRAPTCSPIQMPLQSNTYATVLFGDTRDAVVVGLDEDGQVEGELTAESQPLDNYVRESCTKTGTETFVTVVVWAM